MVPIIEKVPLYTSWPTIGSFVIGPKENVETELIKYSPACGNNDFRVTETDDIFVLQLPLSMSAISDDESD